MQYGVDRETGLIDYPEVERMALEHRPKVSWPPRASASFLFLYPKPETRKPGNRIPNPKQTNKQTNTHTNKQTTQPVDHQSQRGHHTCCCAGVLRLLLLFLHSNPEPLDDLICTDSRFGGPSNGIRTVALHHVEP